MLLTSPPIVRSAVLRLSTTAQKQVNAPVAWQRWGLDGTGIGVAVIDSGVTAVGDLYWWIPSNQTYGSRVVYSQNFVPGTTDSSDQYGHGTHVAGIIAGAGWFSTGSNFTHTFKGIAPNANIINLRVLDQNGAGTDSSVIAAIQTAINRSEEHTSELQSRLHLVCRLLLEKKHMTLTLGYPSSHPSRRRGRTLACLSQPVLQYTGLAYSSIPFTIALFPCNGHPRA